MRRNVRFTLLHVMGLAIGLASVILIAWYVYDELSFDNLTESDRVYRINTYWGDNPKTDIYASTPAPLAAVIEAEIPEVEKVARAFNWNHSTMRLPVEETKRTDEVVFRETRIFIVDPAFLEVLQYPVILGSNRTALERPESIVLTKATAIRYFGADAVQQGSVIGKTILFGGDRTARVVTAVVEPPENTHLHFDMLVNINFGYTELDTLGDWAFNFLHTYVKVNESVQNDPVKQKELQSKLTNIATRYIKLAGAETNIKAVDFKLQPLRDIHLHSSFLREHETNGDYATVRLLVTVASLILLLACANFVNLFTAQSVKRAKEVGVRKALGSAQSSLFSQFFIESALYTITAALFALSIAELLRVPFNFISGKQMRFSWLDHPVLIVELLVAFIAVIILAGSYPSFYLSSFNPVRALKGNSLQQKNHLRNGLVIFQFSISIGLMICSVFILRQLDFMQSRTPGYDRENVIVIKNGEIQDQWRAFRDDLESRSQIKKVSFNTGLPVQPVSMMRDFREPGEAKGTGINLFLVDENYIQTLGLTLVSGSQFTYNQQSNAHKVMINEAAARILGLKDPVGKQLVINYRSRGEEQLEIIGVIRDFNVESLHSNVKPLVFYYYIPDLAFDYIAVRIQPGNPTAALSEVEKAWKKFEPENPFVYSFLDKDFEQQYVAEQRLSKLFAGFTILTISIALLGLTGLASFMAEQRTKEIGIRKVLGATVTGIMVLFSRDFTRLALIAMVIAIPSSYYVMRGWLSDFAYRIDLGPVVFVVCSLVSLVLMWTTVCLLSMRVAKLNPANTLKSE
ncbi:MAG: ABC transporter permease [Chryseolinea sp.]